VSGEKPRPPGVEVPDGGWAARRLRRELAEIWRLAFGPPRRVTAGRWAELTARLDKLAESARGGAWRYRTTGRGHDAVNNSQLAEAVEVVEDEPTTQELAEQVRLLRTKVQAEISRVVVGMDEVARQLLIALLAGGHVC